MERCGPRTRFRRRQLLRTSAAVVAAGIAGCTGIGSNGDGGTPNGPRTDASSGLRSTAEGTLSDSGRATADAENVTPGDARATTTGGDLDLREANVVGVEIDGQDGSYRFSVTLYHDDDGEDGYANWWQVETLEGERLGRRELVHAHGTAPFTRSETIEIPEDVSCVVVRGHDQTHGYGGQAMLVDVGTGATKAGRQGPEPRSFGQADCP